MTSGAAREDHLGAHLDRLLLQVVEHVGAAGQLEHVVEEAVAAARVDVAQRALLPAEDEQRLRPAAVRRRDGAIAASCCSMRVAAASAAAFAPIRAPSARIVCVMSGRPRWT